MVEVKALDRLALLVARGRVSSMTLRCPGKSRKLPGNFADLARKHPGKAYRWKARDPYRAL